MAMEVFLIACDLREGLESCATKSIHVNTHNNTSINGLMALVAHRTADDNNLLGDALLPEYLATRISKIAGVTSFGLRITSLVVYNMLEAARLGCQGSFDITRNAAELILSMASERSDGNNDDYRKHLEGWSTASIHLMHSTLSLAELIHNAGFSLLQSASYLGFSTAEEGVKLLDAFFGSRDTSRTLAGVLCLIRRTYHDQGHNESVFLGLTKSLTTFAMLQTILHDRTMAETRTNVKWKVMAKCIDIQGPPEYTLDERPENMTIHSNKSSTSISSMLDVEIEPSRMLKVPNSADIMLSTEEATTRTTVVELDTAKKDLVDPSWVARNQAVETRSVTGKTRYTIKSVTKRLKTSKFIRTVSGRHIDTPDMRRLDSPRRTLPTTPIPRTKRSLMTPTSSESKIPVPTRTPLSPLDVNHNPSRGHARRLSTISTSSVQTVCTVRPPDPVNDQHRAPWPPAPLFQNMYRFHRFATAAYGQSFLHVLGLSRDVYPSDEGNHGNHHAFAAHVGLDVTSILLSSYSPGSSGSGIVYFLAVDRTSKSLVLTLRGTLGIADVLTDLTGEYCDFKVPWDSNVHQVHKGIYEAAVTLSKSQTLRQSIVSTFEEFPHYGLVITGHSLGAGVGAILGLLWSVPSHGGYHLSITEQRVPVHVYAYACPATISSTLQTGLITTIVNDTDVIPKLSFGTLKDFRNVAIALSHDDTVFRRLRGYLYRSELTPEDENFFYSVWKTLRCDMSNEKLRPPGKIYTLQRSRVYTTEHGRKRAGYAVTCSETWSSDLYFTKSMFTDHSPASYELSLRVLQGVHAAQ